MASSIDRWHERFAKIIGVNNWAPEWYHQSIKRFDAEQVAGILDACESPIGFTFQGFSQDHFGISFFPTELGHRHVNLAPGRDHIKEYSEALHRRGKKFFAYYCFQDRWLWDRNPDWRQKDAEGQDIRSGHFFDLCPNSPYRDHVVRRMVEITAGYAVDGWLLDMLEYATPKGDQIACYCPYCRRKYRARYGTEMPAGTPAYSAEWRQFAAFRFDSIEELMRDITRAVKKEKPELIFTHNAFALRRGSEWESGEAYERLFAYDDVVTNIAGWGGWAGEDVARYVDEIWQNAFYTKAFRGMTDKPVWMQMGRFPYDRDYECQPVREMAISSYAVIVNGGSPFLIDNIYPDGTVDPVAIGRMAEVYREIGSKEHLFAYDGQVQYAGVFYSASSCLRTDLTYPREGRYTHGFQGTCKALMEAHIPYEVFCESNLSAERLARYRVVVLSDACVLTDAQTELLRAYVRGGGGLLAMGSVGLHDADGTPRANFSLSDVLGVDYAAPFNYPLSYLCPTDHPAAGGLDTRLHLTIRNDLPPRVLTHADTETVALAEAPATEVVDEIRVFTYAQDVAPGMDRFEPGVVTHAFGQGRTAYASAALSRVYGLYGYPELRTLFLSLLAHCGGPLPLTVHAPLCVETACYTKGNRYLLHLLNYAVSQKRMLPRIGGTLAEEGLPIHDITFSLAEKRTVQSVALWDGTPLAHRQEDGVLTCTLPVLDLHQLVLIDVV